MQNIHSDFNSEVKEIAIDLIKYVEIYVEGGGGRGVKMRLGEKKRVGKLVGIYKKKKI